MLNDSEKCAGMRRRDNYVVCRSIAQSIDTIGVTGLVAVGLIRQNSLQKVERCEPN